VLVVTALFKESVSDDLSELYRALFILVLVVELVLVLEVLEPGPARPENDEKLVFRSYGLR
jgi:hypothetical protein